MRYVYKYTSPLGGMTMASNGQGLSGLWFDTQAHVSPELLREAQEANLPIFDQTCRWLDTYFSGKVPEFTPLLEVSGTPFQLAVWSLLNKLAYGQLTTYKELAQEIARQRNMAAMSAQAVGNAVGRNPVGIIVPCHRVIGSNGSLTGYAGGLDKKRALLKIEQIELKDGGA